MRLLQYLIGAALLFGCPILVMAQCLEGDCKTGKGVYQFPSNSIYKGAFKHGKFHGYGICNYADGDVYEGWWENGMPEGKGKLIKADNTIYEGIWKKGNLISSTLGLNSGQAVVKVDDVQTGCLVGDCQNGFGIKSFPDGSRYEGDFQDGKFHGKGAWHYKNGDVLETTYQNNFATGEGVVHFSDGRVETVIIQDGQPLMEKKELALRDCNQLDCGNIGHGKYVYPDGTVYVGEFKAGVPHGWGRVKYSNGAIYQGDWLNDAANGYGVFTDATGNEYTGMWKDGKRVADYIPATELEDIPYDEEIKVWAVVVGVSSYAHMPPLRYSDNDAFHLFAMMQSPAGGALSGEQVTVLVDEDATKANIIKTLREVFAKADENDLVMLYFSGHGIEGAFLPIDYDGYNNKLYHKELQEIFDSSRAKHKLCIADACHSGSYDFSSKGDFTSVIDSYYDELSNSEGGMALILSSKAEETSLESKTIRQGVFSHYLLRGMKGEADYDNNKVVTIEELYNYIATNVKSYTNNRQSPLIKGNFDKKMPVSVVWE